MRHLISLKEQTKNDIIKIIQIAQKLKSRRDKNTYSNILKNLTLIMLSQKTSTRTRLSFEAAMTELGGHGIYLDMRSSQFALTDFSHEIQAVMRYGSVLMFRALKVKDVEIAASFNTIPVIDACSEKYHPCQALGDLLTMIENAGSLKKIKKIAWLGIENNVSNTLKLVCSKVGIQIAIIAPGVDKLCVDKELDNMANKSGLVSYTSDIKKGLAGAQYVHTDTWMNMEFFSGGKVKPEFKKEYEAKIRKFTLYQLNLELMNNFAPQARIMHCMPCHVGYEITKEAIESKKSIIFDQAENRLHIQKAIILWLLNKEKNI